MKKLFREVPYIAILRGIQSEEVLEYAQVLVNLNFPVIEVPLNSPDPLESIELLARNYRNRVVIGAGTVINERDVVEVYHAGGKIIVMPHCNETIVALSKQMGMYCVAGVSTISEAFTALQAGADMLKFFPASSLNPQLIKDWQTVLPEETMIFPVGGITPVNMDPFWKLGASGFGLGSALYKAGLGLGPFKKNAEAFIKALS
ncbi:MAG: 2-dehydro-3-deoxy-6-phosphogalactonate aldolase [SAR324 cluster bacterium]|nr:2-dehydro-3-deoxy-6-phosphogalactonate aldolase [SAR324 cluster bacterium]